MTLLCVSTGVFAEPSFSGESLLPWETIAETVIRKSLFDSGTGFSGCRSLLANNDVPAGNFFKKNYVFRTNQPVIIELPAEANNNSLHKVQIDVAKLAQNSWEETAKLAPSVESNKIKLDSGIKSEGFFRFRLVPDSQGKCLSNFEAYAIVCDNWKGDILTFCLGLKEKIETNPDSQLMYSSIAASHFDHIMTLTSSELILSEKALRLLNEAVRAKHDFETGECPNLVIGLNKIRLKRFEGARTAEFAVFVPENYDGSKKWPLFVHPDPRYEGAANNYSNVSGLIDLWWHFPFPKGFEWKDFEYILDVLRNKISLDEDRVYISGECGNAIPVMALALNYPDRWAECRAALGNSYCYLAGNALNLPFIFVRGIHLHPENHYAGSYDFVVKYFRYFGCGRFQSDYSDDVTQIRGVFLPGVVREKSPKRVLYTIESLHNPRAYWVKIDGREDENLLATVDASVEGQTIFVKTRNVEAYSLDIAQSPACPNQPVEIIENGKSLGFVTSRIFTKKPTAYTTSAYVKNCRLCGPVSDAFREPYAVVYGKSPGNEEFSKTLKDVATLLANGGLCFDDANVPGQLTDSHNLILVGTPESNVWLSKICKYLPVQIKDNYLVADGGPYKGRDIGFILIYPNPINPEKYVVVFSATSSLAMQSIPKAYSQIESIQPADVGIFEVVPDGTIKWYVMEKFNTLWGWHNKWDEVLAETKRKHPRWQWLQWVAKIIREQLESDVAICEDHFKFPNVVPNGQITYRDLFNSFKNDWIVKIRLEGKSLKQLLLKQFDNNSPREITSLVIDGIIFSKTEHGTERMVSINELENNRKYTVALPSRAIKGETMGMTLKDYEIVGDIFLISLLKDYFRDKKNLDVDAQLDSLSLNVF
jgi:hypothetical protein